MSSDLAAARDAKTILLTTYKRDGTPVPTPVSIAFDGDRAFFRSYHKAWKTKRLRDNPRVDFAASTLRGKPTGPPVQARAILLEGEQARIAAKALARRHRVLQGILVPLAHRLMHYQTMHYELRSDPGQAFPGAGATRHSFGPDWTPARAADGVRGCRCGHHDGHPSAAKTNSSPSRLDAPALADGDPACAHQPR